MTVQADGKNSQIELSIERKPGCQVSLTITASKELVRACHQRAIKEINRRVSFPGFRKGRAPDQMVLAKHGPAVEKEWRDQVLQASFKEAVTLSGLAPISKETISAREIRIPSLDEGAVYQIEFETRAEIPTVDPTDLSLKLAPLREVTEKERDEEIEGARLFHANWKEIKGRGVQEGDYVVLDIDDLDRGSSIYQNKRVQVKEGSLSEWLIEALIGQERGQSVEVTSERPKELAADHPFQPTLCKVTVKEILQPELPPLDELFFKKVGVETFEQLQERVMERLENSAKEQQRQDLHRQLEKQLADKYPFELPVSAVDKETKVRLKGIAARLESQGMPQEQIQKRLTELESEVRESAIAAICVHLLFQNIARQEELSFTHEELQQQLFQLAMMGQAAAGQDQELVERARIRLFEYKAAEFLIDKILKLQ